MPTGFESAIICGSLGSGPCAYRLIVVRMPGCHFLTDLFGNLATDIDTLDCQFGQKLIS
jgi:hypothetical protein